MMMTWPSQHIPSLSIITNEALMTDSHLYTTSSFSQEVLDVLDSFLHELPEPVRLVLWATPGQEMTRNAFELCSALAKRYDQIDFVDHSEQIQPLHSPLIGIQGVGEEGESIDYHLRILGVPAGYHINSLVGMIQAVSFRGMTLEAVSRIQLSRLKDLLKIEVFSAPSNEDGVRMATLTANVTVVNPNIATTLVMIDAFPQLAVERSIYTIPHTVINARHHLQGTYKESSFLKILARLVKKDRSAA